MKSINNISIKQFLQLKGIYPEKDYRYYGMYHCPYREDRNASFKVDYQRNLWYDFGANEGGTMADLFMHMENCSFAEAAIKLEKEYANKCLYSFSFHRDSISDQIASKTPTIIVRNILPITHPKLVTWVQERKIDLRLANKYCREIHYRNRSKDYFAVGFRNDKGGYELSSSSHFKGCIPPKEITTIRNNHDSCLVFEGFWDFLSYLTLQRIEKIRHDVAVLNSVANVQKAMDFLKSHEKIFTCLDNDEAGRKATELIKSACPSVNDRSAQYAGFKDLNEFLCQKPMIKQEATRKKYGLKP